MSIIKKTKTSEYFVSFAGLIALLWIFPDVNNMVQWNFNCFPHGEKGWQGKLHRIVLISSSYQSVAGGRPASDMQLFRSHPSSSIETREWLLAGSGSRFKYCFLLSRCSPALGGTVLADLLMLRHSPTLLATSPGIIPPQPRNVQCYPRPAIINYLPFH